VAGRKMCYDCDAPRLVRGDRGIESCMNCGKVRGMNCGKVRGMNCEEVRGMDCGKIADALGVWIKERVQAAGCRGIVFGLSGGLDSAVVAGLGMRAIPDGCLGVVMPCRSDPEDVEDALACARAFSLPTLVCDLTSLFDRHLALVSGCLSNAAAQPEVAFAAPALTAVADAAARVAISDPSRSRMAQANLKPRLRMTVLYYYANILGYLVVGTTNRSELTVGYFTKYGDGGSDIMPLAAMVKWQVRELASYLGVPRYIIEKAPTAGLWSGQTDEGEMGMSYAELDNYILTGEADDAVRQRVDSLSRAAQHKLARPLVPNIPLE
jgi:NAD+ synthase